MAGYSGTPLVKKIGIKPGHRLAILNPPKGFEKELAPAGMLWIAWPKMSSGVATDLREGQVREIGLAAGLVDIKICAVNQVWSGLKFVIPVKDRRRMGGK